VTEDIDKYGQAERMTGTERKTSKLTNKQTDKQANGKTDRQA